MPRHFYEMPADSPFVDFSQYIPMLISAIDYELDIADVWAEADRAEALDKVEELKRWLIEWDSTSMPVTTINPILTLWHINSQNHVGNGLVLGISASQIMNHFASQSPAADTDEFLSQDFWLTENTIFVIDAYCVRGSGSGILKLDLMDATNDDQLQTVTQDLYNATAAFNLKVQIGITTTAARKVYLRGNCNGKNAASSGFGLGITCFMIRS